MKNCFEREVKTIFQSYGKICESSSGAISLSVIQALTIAASITKRSHEQGTYWFLTIIAILATISFFCSLLSVGATIHRYTQGERIHRSIIYMIFYPVSIGVLVTAIATLKSM